MLVRNSRTFSLLSLPPINLTGALSDETTKKPTTVPAIYIVKYNRFVDNILEKMNDILRTSYDPVSVKLQPIDANKKTSKPKKGNKTKPKRKSSNKKKNTARGSEANKTKEKTVSEIPETVKEEITQVNDVKPNEVVGEQTPVAESRAIKEKTSEKAKATPTRKPAAKPPGTLYGLSSLRRTGDVSVSIMADHTTVKSNFAVGPLILRVEKEVGRGAKKDIRSATATTAEMLGKLTLRVNNQGVATLHTIKVLQPKQVRVDSNNERTRELVWQRSARIAHVVSEKLLSASKPMFHQQTVVKQ
ncbi:hypothetical protein HW555_000823 [Spodoptera exigua]|uniref:Uncharacterized protein n=1 Tax=Spodoptera exigua TaxID=7107 RepID=A0A835LG27_SPOEX|nr:hypothetical protein HW555_000823 [Spodoptera exigua]